MNTSLLPLLGEQEITKELGGRVKDLVNGKVKGILWEDVKKKATAKSKELKQKK